jgi:ABC-type phosphate/phosphonate transport system substrate-binding protein
MRQKAGSEPITRPSRRGWRATWLLGLTMLAVACQPVVEVVEVEVTRQLAREAIEVTRVVTEVPTPLPPVVEIVTETVTTEVEVVRAPAGSEERPFLLVFPATIPEGIINGRGQALLEALVATGAGNVQLLVTESMAEAARLTCSEPDRVFSFLPALPALWAMDACDARPTLTGVRFDVPWHAGMLVVRVGEGITNLEDVAGLRLGVPEASSVARHEMALATLADAGVEPAAVITYNSDNNVLLALLNGEIDVAVAAYNPPILPFAERAWVFGEDDPELWRTYGVSPNRHPIGYVDVLQGGPDVGGYRIRDARAALFDARRSVFDETRVLVVTEPVPNGVLVVGPQVPWAGGADIVGAITTLVNSDGCGQSICSPDFYNWEGMTALAPDAFAAAEAMVQTLDLDQDALLATDPEY